MLSCGLPVRGGGKVLQQLDVNLNAGKVVSTGASVSVMVWSPASPRFIFVAILGFDRRPHPLVRSSS